MMHGQIDSSEIEWSDEPQRKKLRALLVGVPYTTSSKVVGVLEVPRTPRGTSRETDDRHGQFGALLRAAIENLAASSVLINPLTTLGRVSRASHNADLMQESQELRSRLEEKAGSSEALDRIGTFASTIVDLKRILDTYLDTALPDAAEEASNVWDIASQMDKFHFFLTEGMSNKRYERSKWIRAANSHSDAYRVVGKAVATYRAALVNRANIPEQEKLTEHGLDVAAWVQMCGQAVNVVQWGGEPWPLRFAAALDVDLLYRRQVSPDDAFTLAYTQLARAFTQHTLGTGDRAIREPASELLAPDKGLDLAKATSDLTWTCACDVVAHYNQPVQHRNDTRWDVLSAATGPSRRNTTSPPIPSETRLDAFVERYLGSYERHTFINRVADVDWAVFFDVGLRAERRERWRDKHSFFLHYQQAFAYIADDPASYMSMCKMLKYWSSSFSSDDMLGKHLGCRGKPMRPECGKRWFFGVSLMPTADPSAVADTSHRNHRGIDIAIVEADPALTTVDGYAVTTNMQAIIRLRASLSEDDRSRGKQALLSQVQGRRGPGVFFWHADEQSDERCIET